MWEQSAGQIQSMVKPALSILQKQLESDDQKVALRAAAVLLRFATPSRLVSALGGTSPSPAAGDDAQSSKQYVDDLIAYVDAPLPGQPGAPEDMVDDEDEAEDEEQD
jgi:hypothetical protein